MGLCVILETNPFYAASLTPRAGGGFKLINYDPVGEDATYSTRVMRTIGRNGPQVNVKFSVKPEGGLAIDGFDIFEKGVKVEQSAEHDNYWASVVLYDLFFVAQTMHASIHIFHYVLTNALRYASKDYRRLNNWADEYNGNVNYKYDQVSNLLVNLKGDGILTSSKGLGGSAQTLDIMVGNIAAWGHCSTGTEFHDVWFQRPRASSRSTLSTRTSGLAARSPRPRPSKRPGAARGTRLWMISTSSTTRTRNSPCLSARAVPGQPRRTASRRSAPCLT